MGNDGGSIPTRRELVKEAARNRTTTELKETQKEHLAHRWSSCPLSHTPLRRPVVSDCAGLLYNKDAVLQYLLPAEASALNKEDCDKILQGRIKSLKDVVEVIFEIDVDQSGGGERWICPVTSKELGPAVKAVYLVPCGHAFSHEAIKEMKTEQCLQCNHPYQMENIIILFPTSEDEKSILQRRIDRLSDKGITHSLKKVSGASKKRKADKIAEVERDSSEVRLHTSDHKGSPARQPQTFNPIQCPAGPLLSAPKVGSSSGIKNAAAASMTAKVLQEEEERRKRRLVNGENERLKSLFTKKGDTTKLGDAEFMTRGFRIPPSARYS